MVGTLVTCQQDASCSSTSDWPCSGSASRSWSGPASAWTRACSSSDNVVDAVAALMDGRVKSISRRFTIGTAPGTWKNPPMIPPSISATENRSGVMLKGKWHTQMELNGWLDKSAAAISTSYIEPKK